MRKKNNFKENLSISKNSDIFELQNKYKLGVIKEENLTDMQYKSLVELYDKQNNNLQTTLNMKKQELNGYKNLISNIRKKLQ